MIFISDKINNFLLKGEFLTGVYCNGRLSLTSIPNVLSRYEEDREMFRKLNELFRKTRPIRDAKWKFYDNISQYNSNDPF